MSIKLFATSISIPIPSENLISSLKYLQNSSSELNTKPRPSKFNIIIYYKKPY